MQISKYKIEEDLFNSHKNFIFFFRKVRLSETFEIYGLFFVDVSLSALEIFSGGFM